MAKTINHYIEPNRLLLVWQASEEEGGSRSFRAVGELYRDANNPDNISLSYLVEEDDFKEALADGFKGYPAFGLNRRNKYTNVQKTFLRRLPPKSRSDYPDYLRKFRILADANLTGFSLLGYTEVKLPGDGFSIINPHSDSKPPFEFVTEISGVRYNKENIAGISEGEIVSIVPDPSNAKDPSAIGLMREGDKLGFVNRIQLAGIRKLLNSNRVTAYIDRIYGNEDKPRIQLFVEVE